MLIQAQRAHLRSIELDAIEQFRKDAKTHARTKKQTNPVLVEAKTTLKKHTTDQTISPTTLDSDAVCIGPIPEAVTMIRCSSVPVALLSKVLMYLVR